MVYNSHTMPRAGVGIVLVNQEKQVFVAKRINSGDVDDPYWQMPQGGIDPRENYIEAMIREMKEETGVDEHNAEIIAESKELYTYEIPEKYRKDCSSQIQRWFLVRLNEDDSCINLDQPHAEFSQWKWVPSGHVAKLVIDFKREVYKKVMKDFSWYFDAQ